MKFYTISAVTRFVSGKEITASATLVVSDDVLSIVQSNQVMYNPVNDAYTTQFGSPIGRNYIYKMDLYALNGTIDFTNYVSTLPNLVTANGSYLFKYLPNVTGIILDGFTSLTNTSNSIQDNDKTQVNFSNMTSLQTLSIQNCTGLTGNIDLTMCSELTQVDASGTTVNVLVPTGTKVTKYEVGAPTSISLINPTVLQPTSIVVDSYANLDSLELVNIPNNKSFTAFTRVMNQFLIGGTIIFGKRVNDNGEIVDTYADGLVSSNIYIGSSRNITATIDNPNIHKGISMRTFDSEG